MARIGWKGFARLVNLIASCFLLLNTYGCVNIAMPDNSHHLTYTGAHHIYFVSKAETTVEDKKKGEIAWERWKTSTGAEQYQAAMDLIDGRSLIGKKRSELFAKFGKGEIRPHGVSVWALTHSASGSELCVEYVNDLVVNAYIRDGA